MPLLGMLHLFVAIGFIVHAHKTGRPQFWFLVLIFVPLVGSIAYVLFERAEKAALEEKLANIFKKLGL